MAGSFSFDTSRFKSPEEMEKRLQRAILGVARYYDGRVESHAKQRAPWTDRTTNARSGLSAKAVKLSVSAFAIILSHAVTYGIYLETRWNAKYAIIMPTIRVYAPKVMRTLNKILDRL